MAYYWSSSVWSFNAHDPKAVTWNNRLYGYRIVHQRCHYTSRAAVELEFDFETFTNTSACLPR